MKAGGSTAIEATGHTNSAGKQRGGGHIISYYIYIYIYSQGRLLRDWGNAMILDDV